MDAYKPNLWYLFGKGAKSFFSMGGAIAVHVAADRLLKSLVGLVVIDVVEGMIA